MNFVRGLVWGIFPSLVLWTVLGVAACSNAPTQAQLQVDAGKALYYLQAAGCLTAEAAQLAGPFTASLDAKGNAVLNTVASGAGKVCSISVPAAAVSPAKS